MNDIDAHKISFCERCGALVHKDYAEKHDDGHSLMDDMDSALSYLMLKDEETLT